MTARPTRRSTDAFAGVYGASPDELYGRFAASSRTTRSTRWREARSARCSAPRSIPPPRPGEGTLVQRLRWGTGAPALSRDDSLLALVRDDPDHAPRVVIWHLGRATSDSGARVRTAEELARDPEDVAPVESRPPSLPVVAELGARGGMSFAEPRFFRDGRHVLLTALSARGDGAFRRDLYVWTWRTGDVRRVHARRWHSPCGRVSERRERRRRPVHGRTLRSRARQSRERCHYGAAARGSHARLRSAARFARRTTHRLLGAAGGSLACRDNAGGRRHRDARARQRARTSTGPPSRVGQCEHRMREREQRRPEHRSGVARDRCAHAPHECHGCRDRSRDVGRRTSVLPATARARTRSRPRPTGRLAPAGAHGAGFGA